MCTSGDDPVVVSVSGASPGSQNATCSGSNSWTAMFNVTGIADGTSAITATAIQTDVAGNTGNAMTVSAVKDTVAPTIAIMDNGSAGDEIYNELEDAAVIFSGTSTAEPGQTVQVNFDDGANIISSSAIVQAGGNWTVGGMDIPTLNNGPITLSADTVDMAGNSALSAIVAVTLNNGLPNLTAIDVGPSNVTIPEFSGTTDQPLGFIVTVKGNSNAILCNATVAAGGIWACRSAIPLSEGLYNFTAEIDDGFGNVRIANFTVDVDLDADDDGIPDSLDTDSDNDGIPDVFENTLTSALLGTDSDQDGIDDALDVNITAGVDVNANGIDDRFEPLDSDQDGIPDHLDLVR